MTTAATFWSGFPLLFGFCGAFSPAFWPGDRGLRRTAETLATGRNRIYLDVGTREGHVLAGLPTGRPMAIGDPDVAYLEGVRELRDTLLSRGYRSGVSLRYVEEAGAVHHEDAWAGRLPEALRFLLPRLPATANS